VSVGISGSVVAGRGSFGLRTWFLFGVAVIGLAGVFSPAAAAAAGWSIQPTPNPASAAFSELWDVSCTSVSECTAAGDFYNSAGEYFTLVERWNGSQWSIHPTPNPAGTTGSRLFGVSCTSAQACTAAGSFYSASTELTLVERWNGSQWSIQPTPNPAGTTVSRLAGVSCPSARACTAVGTFGNSAGEYSALAERWNGSQWSIQPTPNPTGTFASVLDGVSCTSARACTAVGYFTNSAGNEIKLAERWNGSQWSIQATPNPAEATYSDFDGVSCASARVCTTAGNFYKSAGKEFTLAERWNGFWWSIEPTPNPTEATYSGLNGVSCTSARACTTAGNFQNSAGKEFTLAERWDGSRWSIQHTPNPVGATGRETELYGVSCPSATACTAAGTFQNSAGKALTLVEKWTGAG
jgi:hypothetical protein